jgi:hypothetical protein
MKHKSLRRKTSNCLIKGRLNMRAKKRGQIQCFGRTNQDISRWFSLIVPKEVAQQPENSNITLDVIPKEVDNVAADR